MQFINLQTQYRRLETDINQRIKNVLEHGQYIMGPEVQQLEEQLAAYIGVKHCISVANGTDALLIAMMALDIRPGDEIITTPFTFIANGEMIAMLGAIPVFVDINPQDYNIDASKIAAAITEKTKCIMPISLYGQCSDMGEINQIAANYSIPVIEDAAQSFGALYRQKKSCGLSLIGCTSFFPTKPLGCYGDGGACFTDDDVLATTMRQIRIHGQDKRYSHRLIGMNSRLDTLQAAILLAKFSVFDNEVQRRLEIGARYNRLIDDKIKKIVVSPDKSCVYAQYTIEVDARDDVQAYLKSKNIPTAVHYPKAIYQQAAFIHHPQKDHDFPVTEKAVNAVMSLPMHPYLTDLEQDQIIENLMHAVQKSRENEKCMF